MGERLVSAFWDGLSEAFSVPAIAIALIFFIFLSSVGKNSWRTLVAGLAFLLSSWFSRWIFIFGGFDEWLSQSFVLVGLRIFYGILALFFLILGVGHLWDWYRYGRNFKTQPSQAPSHPRKIYELVYLVSLSIVSFVLGGFLSLLSSVSIRDYKIFIDFMRWVSEEGGMKSFFILGLYIFSLTLPMIIIWILMIVTRFKKPVITPAMISLSKVFLAAIFLSTAVGLAFISLKY